MRQGTAELNKEQANLQQILTNLIVAMLVFSVPLAGTMLARGGENVEFLYLSQVAGVALLYLTRRGQIQFVRYAVTVVLFALITALSAFGQGVRDNAIPAYFAMLSLSALVIGPNAPIVFAILISIAYASMAILENAKILVTGYSLPPSWSSVVYFVSIVFLAAILFRATIRQLQKSIVRAEQSEKTLAERNRELEASQAEIRTLNQSLEKRVKERTQALETARQRAMLIADTSARMTRAQTEEEIVSALREIAQRYRAAFSTLSYYEVDEHGKPVAIQTIALQGEDGQFFPLDQLGQTYFVLNEYPLARLGIDSPDVPIFLEDFMNDARVGAAEKEVGKAFFIGAMVIVPLRARGVWQAQLSFTWRQPRAFDPEDRELIAELMPRLADNVAARRAYLAEQAARQRAMLIADTSTRMARAQNEHDILTSLRDVLQFADATYAALSYWDVMPDGQPKAIQLMALLNAAGQPTILERTPNTYFPLDQYPHLGIGLTSPDYPLFIENIETDPHCDEVYRQEARTYPVGAQVIIPLRARGAWQGQLAFSWQDARTFDPDFRNLIADLMPRLADNVAARRAYLAEQAARRENERLYAEQRVIAEKLREADEMKTNFLASMSHELRTPLNSILNFTRFVSSGMFGPINDRQLDALNKTLSSGKHLLNLINDVLDVTKIEANMLNLFIEGDVDLLAEIETAITSSHALLEDKDVALIRDVPPSLPRITGDKRRVRQILLNLLSNACKFTEEGTITVHAGLHDGRILMYVRDTGPGIPLDDQQIIFEPFRQSRKGLTQGGGTGLGLAIARRLAEAHEGRLWLESRVGQGATFYVELPVESAKLHQKMIETGGSKA